MSNAVIVGDPQHNHNRKLAKLVAEGRLGGEPGLFHFPICHDDWCRCLQGRGFCDCDPDIIVDREKLEPATADWKEEQPTTGTIPSQSYRLYTLDEFLRAQFPPPNLDDDRFSGRGKPDLAAYAPKGRMTKKFLMLVLESTARLTQDLVNSSMDDVVMHFVFGVARKGTLTCRNLEEIIESSGADGFSIDLNTLCDSELAQVRKEFKRAGIAT